MGLSIYTFYPLRGPQKGNLSRHAVPTYASIQSIQTYLNPTPSFSSSPLLLLSLPSPSTHLPSPIHKSLPQPLIRSHQQPVLRTANPTPAQSQSINQLISAIPSHPIQSYIHTYNTHNHAAPPLLLCSGTKRAVSLHGYGKAAIPSERFQDGWMDGLGWVLFISSYLILSCGLDGCGASGFWFLVSGFARRCVYGV